MKLVVLGANGRTGRLVMQEALADGDTVVAVVRSKAKRPEIRHDRLTVIVGDCCDPKFLAQVFAGQDAVISTLGGRSPTKHATSIYWRSADAIAEAARQSGLNKVAVTSSALLFPARRFVDRLLKTLVPNVVRSATQMEEILHSTRLDLVVARCGFLTNGAQWSYRRELGALPENGTSVSRLSLARFLVDAVRDAQPGARVFGVSGGA
jgi:putative NADH-flavin reductase